MGRLLARFEEGFPGLDVGMTLAIFQSVGKYESF